MKKITSKQRKIISVFLVFVIILSSIYIVLGTNTVLKFRQIESIDIVTEDGTKTFHKDEEEFKKIVSVLRKGRLHFTFNTILTYGVPYVNLNYGDKEQKLKFAFLYFDKDIMIVIYDFDEIMGTKDSYENRAFIYTTITYDELNEAFPDLDLS